MAAASTTDRITTREAARLLGARSSEALLMLRFSGARGTACGPALLWDLRDVQALLTALRAAGLLAGRLPEDIESARPGVGV